MSKVKIYLAGGYRSNWQKKIEDALIEDCEIFNPRAKEYVNGERVTMEFKEYATWDFHKIRSCDIVFAYFEKTNPSGIGAAIEVGYSYGIGKTVISVIEKDNQFIKDKYMKFIEKASHISFDSFEDGLAYLKSLAQ